MLKKTFLFTFCFIGCYALSNAQHLLELDQTISIDFPCEPERLQSNGISLHQCNTDNVVYQATFATEEMPPVSEMTAKLLDTLYAQYIRGFTIGVGAEVIMKNQFSLGQFYGFEISAAKTASDSMPASMLMIARMIYLDGKMFLFTVMGLAENQENLHAQKSIFFETIKLTKPATEVHQIRPKMSYNIFGYKTSILGLGLVLLAGFLLAIIGIFLLLKLVRKR